ncbi:hypothetical protein V6U71_10325 [Sphingopyxis sp. J-6]|uniref:hypothetical protein n=1 Tax=Sphingopyxis sp. J-6 TaxID=3122054 RepID=UPI0039845ACE
MADTSKYLRWAAVGFVFFWAMQWAFGVREPGANEAARWIIGAGKVLAMLAVVGLAGRLLYLKWAGRKTESGNLHG